MILLARASGTDKVPPFIIVPTGAVRMVLTWHMPQPIASNTFAPACAAGVMARTKSRGGAFVERMKRANASRSSWEEFGLGPWSYVETSTPIEVRSTEKKDVVMPI